MNKRTPIKDVNHKIDIIEHVNQDHQKELLALTQSHINNENISSAEIKDIYQEGVLVQISKANASQEEVFVPFELDGDLEEQILYLAYAAMVKQGEQPGRNQNQFFEVIGKQKLTANLLRLELKSTMAFSANSPALAYGFSLKVLNKAPDTKAASKGAKTSYVGNLVNRFLLWLIKRLSSKNRRRLLESMSKGIRYYTLRKAWKSSAQAPFLDRGSVDVYLHGNTPGSNWAQNLKAGDIIRSQNEIGDKHEHLHQGQAVLIADETAYPALAGILDNWQNPNPPIVFILSSQESEQAYFEEHNLPEGTQVTRIVCHYNDQGAKVVEHLKNTPQIDCAWGALEGESAKTIRYYLRNERDLKGKANRIKAYWRADKAI